MVSSSAFSCALALLAIVSVANAKTMCTPMDPKEKAMYEEGLDTDFMGCTLTLKESMTALSRMNWMTPSGGMPILEMDRGTDVDMSEMAPKKDVNMVMAGMKVAGASVGRSGMMTVSNECLMSLEPDFVYSCLAKSSTPKEYNAHLAAACGGNSVKTISTSVRADETTVATGTAVICVVTAVLGLFFPALDPDLIAGLKTIVTTVFTVLPCPSMGAMMP